MGKAAPSLDGGLAGLQYSGVTCADYDLRRASRAVTAHRSRARSSSVEGSFERAAGTDKRERTVTSRGACCA